MSHSIEAKQGKQIFLITVSDPFDFRTELAQLTEEMRIAFGEITSTIHVIFDIRHLSFNFADIISGVSGFARPQTDFDKILMEHSRMTLVGATPLITIAAKTAARLAPSKPTFLFETPEEALENAKAELSRQR